MRISPARRSRTLVVVGAAITMLGASTVASAAVPSPGSNCPVPTPATFTSTTVVPIPDNGTTSSPIVVSGLSGRVLDVDVVTRVPHAAAGDVTMVLVGPTGKKIVLTAGVGAGAANVYNGTLWDDSANPGGSAPTTPNEGLAADHSYVSGIVATPLVPIEALGAFLGDEPNGQGTLEVTDLEASDTGSIEGWSISIATETNSSLPTIALLGPRLLRPVRSRSPMGRRQPRRPPWGQIPAHPPRP